MTEVHLPVLNLEIILVCGNVLVDTDFRLRCTLMFDLHFQVEWCNTLQRDGDDFFAL